MVTNAVWRLDESPRGLGEQVRAKSHKGAISDLSRTNPTWNRPVTKNLSGKLQLHLRIKSVNKTPRHALSAWCWAVFDELRRGFWWRLSICDWCRWAVVNASSIIQHVRIDPSWWILCKFAVRGELVARTRIHVVAKWDRDQFYREVYGIETLLHITCQIISESKHPRFCFPRFVSIWPAPEVVDGIFEVCPAATKFCPLVNKPVALAWFFIVLTPFWHKQFCPLVL